MARYVLNRVLIQPFFLKELHMSFIIKKNLQTFRISVIFGCRCFVLNIKDNLDKFTSKSNDGICPWIFNF